MECSIDTRACNRVKVVHESLLTWDQAKKALDENLSALLLRSRLHDRALLWNASGRIADRLLQTGLEVDEAAHLLASHGELLDAVIDRDYVGSSIEAHRQALQQRRLAEEAATRHRLAQRKQRIFLLTAAIVSAIGLAGSVVFRFDLDRAWARHALVHQEPARELATLANTAVFTECEGALKCPQMVVLDGASYAMGSPSDETGRFDDEGPQHSVVVSRFAIGKFDVSFDE